MTQKQAQAMRLANRRGFTLLELMVATAILLITILGLLTVFLNCLFLNESNANTVTAVNDAQYVLEQIKALGYDDIDTYVPPVLTNLSGESVSVSRTYGTNIVEVGINVSWNERQRNRSFQLSTKIAR